MAWEHFAFQSRQLWAVVLSIKEKLFWRDLTCRWVGKFPNVSYGCCLIVPWITLIMKLRNTCLWGVLVIFYSVHSLRERESMYYALLLDIAYYVYCIYVCLCGHMCSCVLLSACVHLFFYIKEAQHHVSMWLRMTNLLSLSTATQLSTAWPGPCFPASLTRRQAACLLNYPRSPNGVLIFKGNGCMA